MGLSDSFEAYYQGVRRCWRFGQKENVHNHIITSDMEGNVVKNIARKERDAAEMADNMMVHMKDIQNDHIGGFERTKTEYQPALNMNIPAFLEAV